MLPLVSLLWLVPPVEAAVQEARSSHASTSVDELSNGSTDRVGLPIAQAAETELASPQDDFSYRSSVPAADAGGVLTPLPRTAPEEADAAVETSVSGPLTPPSLNFQAAAIQTTEEEFSARARLRGYYFLESNVLAGATVDLTTGEAFSDTDSTGLSISELYIAASPENMPGLRGAVGILDLTSYFDRNSFAKDSLTHFFNPVFQTNPALAVTQLESQPAALVNWRPVDQVSLKAAAFSSDGISGFDLDGFAGELGLSLGNFIVRGTYVSADDAGDGDGLPESFQLARNGQFGPQDGDREVAYGINAEWYFPSLKAGLFGRYGHYDNRDLDISGETYSFGLNLLDLFMEDDRLGVGYGWGLANEDLRQGDIPDVFEMFYDVRLAPNVRAAVDWQMRDGFSEPVFGLRVRADWELLR